MHKTTTLPFFFYLFFVPVANAQNDLPCATDLLHQQALQNPVFFQQHQSLEQEAYDFFSLPAVAERGSQVLTVPLVVHIIHDNGPENISDAAVQQAIAWLNQAFANQGYYDQGSGADAGIQFCLAQRTPDGSATNGITRDQNALAEFTAETQEGAMKNINRWKPKDYINIWVVRDICSTTYGCGIVAYAYYPSYHGNNLDGIVVEANFLNSASNVSVLAHEMGHYFGLYHTFEGGCTNNDCLLNGDKVCDTPPDQSTAAVPCDQAVNTCSTDAQSGFATDQPDMTRNHMDYGHIDCKHDFTPGQADRMNYFLNGARKSLLDSKGCLPPCPLPVVAAFTPGDTTINAGQTLFFDNNSQNAVNFSWTLNGAPFGGQQNAAYLFDSAGVFTVQLVAQPLNAQLCEASSAQVTVQVVCPVVADFTLSNLTPEEGQTVYIANTSQNALQYEWFVNGVSQGATLDSIVFTESGSYEIRLVGKGDFCQNSATEEVFVRDSCTSKTFVLDNSILNEPDEWEVKSNAILTDGNILLAGNTNQNLSDIDSSQVFFIKCTQDGGILWVKLAGKVTGLGTSFSAVAATPDGGYAAILFEYDYFPDTLGKTYLAKFSSDGSIIWVRNLYQSFFSGSPYYDSDLTVLPGGEIIVDDALKFDPNGNLLWSKTNSLLDVTLKTAPLPDGGGVTLRGLYGVLVSEVTRFDKNGDVLWCKHLNIEKTYFQDIAVDPDSNILVLGRRYTLNNAGVYHSVLLQLTPQGEIIWSRRYFYKETSWFIPAAFALIDNGITVVAHISKNIWPANIKHYRAMFHIDFEGNIVWARHFDDNYYTDIDLYAIPNGYVGIKGFDWFKTDMLGYAGECSGTSFDLSYEDIAVILEPISATTAPGPESFPPDTLPVVDAPSDLITTDTICIPACPRGAELCNNNLDDDEDGLFDCLDPDCNCPVDICSPGQANIWYFGDHAGLDFSTEPPTVLTDGAIETIYPAATACDELGHLLFYTDGDTVFNRFHQPMPNGMNLIDIAGSPVLQALIVPNPADKAQYYLFALGGNIYSTPLWYSLIDMRLDEGRGDVVPGQKSVMFHPTLVKNHFTAIRSCSFDGYWLLVRDRLVNNYFVYKIGQNGLDTTPVFSGLGDSSNIVLGQMKFAPDGKRIARTGGDNLIEVCDFDASTGIVSNRVPINLPGIYRPLGVEFSSNGRYLYFSAIDIFGYKLFQMDLEAGSPDQIIYSLNLLASEIGSNTYFGTLQLAPNGKIYIAPQGLASSSVSAALHVIHHPDLPAPACQFQKNGQLLTGTPGAGFGLVNVVQSLFAKPAVRFRSTVPDTICILDSLYTYTIEKTGCFSSDSIVWKMEGLAGTLNDDYAYGWVSFNAPGEGNIIATAYTQCGIASDTLRIVVAEPFDKTLDLGPDRTVCDNGVFTFNAGSGFARYRWQNGAPDSVLTTLLPGQYWVDVWDACGNQQTDTVTISIAPATVLDLGDDQEGCDDLTATFQRPEFFSRWQWTPGDFISCDTCASVTAAPTATTSWIVVAQTDDDCISVDTLTFQIRDTLFFQLDTSVCVGRTIDLFGVALPADTTAQFFFPATGPGCDTLLTVNVLGLDAPMSEVQVNICPDAFFDFNGSLLPADTTAVFLFPGTGSACDSTVTVSVSAWPSLAVTLPPDTTLRVGATLHLTAETTGTAPLSFAWSSAGGLSCADCPNPAATPLETTLYTLSVADANGCSVQDSVLVTVDLACAVIIPNAFTPNGDGVNDRFYPKTDPCVRMVRAWRVVSRWGETVFERFNFLPNDPAQGWDGNRANGEPYPSDVLVWYAELEYYDGTKEVRKGDVALLR